MRRVSANQGIAQTSDDFATWPQRQSAGIKTEGPPILSSSRSVKGRTEFMLTKLLIDVEPTAETSGTSLYKENRTTSSQALLYDSGRNRTRMWCRASNWSSKERRLPPASASPSTMAESSISIKA